MKVHVKYRVHGVEGRFRLKSYDTAVPPTPCCKLSNAMGNAWGGIVDLGLRGLSRISNVRVVFCTAIHMTNGEVIRAVTPISYCPWCGECIEIIDAGLDTSPEEPAHRSIILNTNP